MNMKAIGLLLGDVSFEEFIQASWTKEFRHIIGSPERFSNLLTWSSFTKPINSFPRVFTQHNFRLVHKREIVPFYKFSVLSGNKHDPVRLISPLKVAKMCRDGAMLTVRDMAFFTDGLTHLSSNLRSEMRTNITVNAYYSQTTEQGFEAKIAVHTKSSFFKLRAARGGTCRRLPTNSPSKMTPTVLSTDHDPSTQLSLHARVMSFISHEACGIMRWRIANHRCTLR